MFFFIAQGSLFGDYVIFSKKRRIEKSGEEENRLQTRLLYAKKYLAGGLNFCCSCKMGPSQSYDPPSSSSWSSSGDELNNLLEKSTQKETKNLRKNPNGCQHRMMMIFNDYLSLFLPVHLLLDGVEVRELIVLLGPHRIHSFAQQMWNKIKAAWTLVRSRGLDNVLKAHPWLISIKKKTIKS
jgi:hypothetical protein